jgi:hypothetical protein
MKMKMLLTVSAIAMLALRTAAADDLAPPQGMSGLVPPRAVLAMVHSSGFEPLGPPLRRGRIYWLHAINPRGRDVALTIDAVSGQIVSVSPVGPALRYGAVPYDPMYDPPPPYGRYESAPYGRPYAYGPPGYGPQGYGPQGYGQPGYGPNAYGRDEPLADEGGQDMVPPGRVPYTGTVSPQPDRSAGLTPPRTPLPRPRPADPVIASSTQETKTMAEPSQIAPTQAPTTVVKDQDAPAAKSSGDLPPVTPLD